MATISEDYVSFETAKLLKEKGFDEYCPLWYNLDKPEEGPFFYKEIGWYGHNSYDYNGKRIVSAPTLQKAMKWLREVHNWTICISPYWPEGDMRNKLTWYYDIHSLIDNRSFREFSYTDNYTEATETAIKFCLENLI